MQAFTIPKYQQEWTASSIPSDNQFWRIGAAARALFYVSFLSLSRDPYVPPLVTSRGGTHSFTYYKISDVAVVSFNTPTQTDHGET